MTTITSTEAGATGRYINLGSPSSQDDVGAQTVIAYCKPTASGGGGLGYLISKATPSGWLRSLVIHNSGSPYFGLGADSSGSALNPGASSAPGSITYGAWQHLTYTWDGGLDTANMHLYLDGSELSLSSISGSGSIISDAAGDLILLNRNTTNREFVGDVAYVARWNRILDSTERSTVRASGPLAVPSGLILCWANQQDYGPYALTPTSRTTFVGGSLPPNTALGDSSDVTIGLAGQPLTHTQGALTKGLSKPVTGQSLTHTLGAFGVQSGSGATVALTGQSNDITQGAPITAVSKALTGQSYTLSQGVLTSATLTEILSPADRGNIALASSSVSNPETATPTLNLQVRTMQNDWQPGLNLQFVFYGQADGVNTKTPLFKMLGWTSTTHNTSTEIFYALSGLPYNASTYRPLWSYDNVTWTEFDNFSYDADNLHFNFSNNSPFSQGTVYFCTFKPWLESYTATWLSSLPTTYISETPSVAAFGGDPYQCGVVASRVNELAETIDACKLYAFKISSGPALAPNGQPKKKFILSAGNHAGEDQGNWTNKATVEFLISEDAKAVTARQWLDFYCYPMLVPAGRRGGHWRSDFEPGKLTLDANRHWTDSLLPTINAFKSAISLDTGNVVAGLISNHGCFPTQDTTYGYPSTEGSIFNATIGAYTTAYNWVDSTLAGAMHNWGVASLGARFGIIPEIATSKTHAEVVAYGEALAKTISDLAAVNYFSYGAVDAGLTGQSLTHTQGVMGVSVVSDVSVSITGQSYAPSQGAVTKSIVIAVPGQSLTHTQGTLAAVVDGNTTIQLTGQAVTCTQGSVAPGASLSIAGQAYSQTQGALVADVGSSAIVGLTGQSYALSQGLVGIAATVGLTGQYSSFAQGSLGVTNDTTYYVTLAGQSYTHAQGYIGFLPDAFDASPDAIITVVNKRNRVSVISRRS